jgi:hypothetical protein
MSVPTSKQRRPGKPSTRKSKSLGYAYGFTLGQLRFGREILRSILIRRFDILPYDMYQQIEACMSVSRLRKAVLATMNLRSLDDFQL